jgi:hypothetical protein
MAALRLAIAPNHGMVDCPLNSSIPTVVTLGEAKGLTDT